MIKITADNGVVYYRSELISCPHGFSTRIGGVSELPHTKSLNLGIGRGDPSGIVIENLTRFAEAIGVEPNSFISADQIHSANVRTVTEKDKGEGYYFCSAESCDGYVTDNKGITLGIKTADCVPILLYYSDKNTSRSVISAVHAGWRGTHKNITSVAVLKMIEMGSVADKIKVAIGPSIRSCCYEVAEEFYQAFCDSLGEDNAKLFIKPTIKKDGHYLADLVGINRYLLEKCGILPQNIDVAEVCTFCCQEEFYSHRRSGNERGTMLSAISLGTEKHK